MNIETIEQECQQYAEARSRLAEIVRRIKTEQEAVKRQHLNELRAAISEAQQRREELYLDVEVSPELFQRPKSRILHGIKVGWRKARGKLSFPDPKKLVAKIRKQLPERADDLIKTEEKPIRAELNKLDAATLRRLGVEVEADQEMPVVEPTDSEIDRIVDALVDNSDLEDAA